MGARLIKTTIPNEGEIFCKYLESRLIRNNKNVLGAELGSTGCLSESTIVQGQTKTVGELYSSGKNIIDTISITQPKKRKGKGCYYPKKSKSEIIDSGIKDVYEIELENGKKVLATSEHKFFKQEGANIVEEVVSNLKVGDCLRDYPEDYSDSYFSNARIREQKKRDENYNWKFLCTKCGSLFYRENKGEKKVCCKNCSIKKKIKSYKYWFEWEDNILRQFYYDYTKEELIKLLPLRKTWEAISHRAHRLHLKRNPKYQFEQNAWTSENNPMHNPNIIKKVKESINKYYETHSSWNKGIKQWENKEHPRGMFGKNHTEKTKEIISISISGDKAPNWRGGISFEPYDLNFNKRFKKQIKLRDNNRCQICGEENNLVIHHIDYDKINSNETNCITLCGLCHGKTNYNRKYWERLLSNLILNKYNYIKCTQQRLSQ